MFHRLRTDKERSVRVQQPANRRSYCCELLSCCRRSSYCELFFFSAVVQQHLTWHFLLSARSHNRRTMACDVASSPFHETSAFEDDWEKCITGRPEIENLGLIADFNASCDSNVASFDQNNNSSNDCNGIDPQLLNSVNGSPSGNTGSFDQDLGREDLFAYPDYSQPTPANTPYFHNGATPHMQAPPVFATPLGSQHHRRSVSEPPEAFPHSQPAPRFMPGSQPVTFHRSGHYLGAPKPQVEKMKSLPRNKSNRAHPYAGGASRYPLRRTHTQPVHARPVAPTSMPQPVFPGSHGPPPQFQLQPHQVISTRVCTPAPSPVREIVSPGLLDPALMAEKRVVSVPVDELRSMITEAVRKAVEGIEAAKKDAAVRGSVQAMKTTEEGEVVAETIECGAENDDEDTIAVMKLE